MGLMCSSIGRKMVMGICGLVWTLFVFAHMAGNLLIFAGAETYNKYGHAITSNKPLLFFAEAVLILSLIVHVVLAIQLTRENRKAKPLKYAVGASSQKTVSPASKTMIFHGVILLFFIISHLLTFKYGTVYTVTYDGVEMRDLHKLIVEVFQQPGFVVGYVFCLILLGAHLSHGTSSVFQSLGLNHPSYTPKIKAIGFLYAFVVTAGFIAQPIYVALNS